MDKKGQVVMEIMVVVSILVIGLVLFGMFYLNKHPMTFGQANIISNDGLRSPIEYSEVTVPARVGCGNNLCEAGETCDSCPSDCHCPENCPCSTDCGNGILEGAEQCDGNDLNNQSCSSLNYYSGILSCNDNCTFNTSACTILPVCGNGIIEDVEECDSGNLNDQSCSSLDLGYGDLSCNDYCTFNTSLCVSNPFCGNGILEGTEQCDRDDLNSNSCSSLNYDYGTLSCNDGCFYNTEECKFLPASNCFSFDSGGWRKYNTTDPDWYQRGNMSTWPDHSAIWLCPHSTCTYITDYYFLYNSFSLSETTKITISALGDDETKVWLWPNKDIATEILVISRHVWTSGWDSNTLTLSPGNYSVVQLIYDTNQSATGAILSVKNENTGAIILNTDLNSGWYYYRTMKQLEEERYSSSNGCSRVYSNQFCGNEIIEGNEQCDGPNLGNFFEKTCSDLNSSWDIGNLSCNINYCQIDTSDCNQSIELTLRPDTGSTRRNRNFNTKVSVIGDSGKKFNLTASIQLRDDATKVYKPTTNCKYVNTGIYSSTFYFGNQTIPVTSDYGFNCKTRGTYLFTFTGTLENGKFSEDSSIRTITN